MRAVAGAARRRIAMQCNAFGKFKCQSDDGGTHAVRAATERTGSCVKEPLAFISFLADRTIGRAFGTVCRLSVCLSVCNVLYCGSRLFGAS